MDKERIIAQKPIIWLDEGPVFTNNNNTNVTLKGRINDTAMIYAGLFDQTQSRIL